MSDSLPLDTKSGDSPSNDDAFGALANGTRLAILQALWDSYDPMNPAPVKFSSLQKIVDIDDPGKLNYHLTRLMDHFIRRTDAGYELREPGKRLARILRSGTVVDDPSIDPVQIDVACLFCGGSTELDYAEGWLSHRCKECHARCVSDYTPGLLSKEELPPAGLLGRAPNEVYRANRTWIKYRELSVMDRVCPECSGSMPVKSIQICEDHDPDPEDESVCESCGSIFWGIAFHTCEVCKLLWKMPTLFYPPTHPSVVAFYYDHGIEFDLASHEQRALMLDYQEEVISEDPLEIQTTVPVDSDEIQVTFDDEMRIVSVTE